MKTLMVAKLGQPLGMSTWRHLAQAIIRYGMQKQVPEEGPGDDQDNEGLGAQQMHHSRRTGQQIYGRQQCWHTYLGLAPGQIILDRLFYPHAEQRGPGIDPDGNLDGNLDDQIPAPGRAGDSILLAPGHGHTGPEAPCDPG
ncbi:uncharacterized protein BDW43DRAFT_317466 [Aspergillus alliaceus]|uniref:uncharacterized protein n=1 Tax=Petromyces alliaceus TaxID=209559 RepID=UPI0012A65ACE|nr:uncharacterized protein BDW43DRAFT_317466 [Aspergillus alliaceus]KAB8226805.1 hypothetical protein BDW43DRAFT_317466 [Aspergillus alliaceus]